MQTKKNKIKIGRYNNHNNNEKMYNIYKEKSIFYRLKKKWNVCQLYIVAAAAARPLL
jgi:hypothetical protein